MYPDLNLNFIYTNNGAPNTPPNFTYILYNLNNLPVIQTFTSVSNQFNYTTNTFLKTLPTYVNYTFNCSFPLRSLQLYNLFSLSTTYLLPLLATEHTLSSALFAWYAPLIQLDFSSTENSLLEEYFIGNILQATAQKDATFKLELFESDEALTVRFMQSLYAPSNNKYEQTYRELVLMLWCQKHVCLPFYVPCYISYSYQFMLIWLYTFIKNSTLKNILWKRNFSFLSIPYTEIESTMIPPAVQTETFSISTVPAISVNTTDVIVIFPYVLTYSFATNPTISKTFLHYQTTVDFTITYTSDNTIVSCDFLNNIVELISLDKNNAYLIQTNSSSCELYCGTNQITSTNNTFGITILGGANFDFVYTPQPTTIQTLQQFDTSSPIVNNYPEIIGVTNFPLSLPTSTLSALVSSTPSDNHVEFIFHNLTDSNNCIRLTTEAYTPYPWTQAQMPLDSRKFVVGSTTGIMYSSKFVNFSNVHDANAPNEIFIPIFADFSEDLTASLTQLFANTIAPPTDWVNSNNLYNNLKKICNFLPSPSAITPQNVTNVDVSGLKNCSCLIWIGGIFDLQFSIIGGFETSESTRLNVQITKTMSLVPFFVDVVAICKTSSLTFLTLLEFYKICPAKIIEIDDFSITNDGNPCVLFFIFYVVNNISEAQCVSVVSITHVNFNLV